MASSRVSSNLDWLIMDVYNIKDDLVKIKNRFTKIKQMATNAEKCIHDIIVRDLKVASDIENAIKILNEKKRCIECKTLKQKIQCSECKKRKLQ